jgi:hypothetical protein
MLVSFGFFKYAERALDFACTGCGIELANVDKIPSKQFISCYDVSSLIKYLNVLLGFRWRKRGLSVE